MSVLVRVNERRIVLPEDEVPGFEAAVLAAVAAGGAFISVGGADGVSRVLVTPATTVITEQQDDLEVVEADEDDFPDLSFLDFDFDT